MLIQFLSVPIKQKDCVSYWHAIYSSRILQIQHEISNFLCLSSTLIFFYKQDAYKNN